MGHDDIKNFENNLISAENAIKHEIEIKATNEIEALFSNEHKEVQNKMYLIKNIIADHDIELREKTSFINTITELTDKYSSDKINIYNIDSKSVFSIFNHDDVNFFRDAFITIGGNSSSGKTSLVTQIVKDILISNKNAICLFYSLDDGSFMGYRRFISHLNKKYELPPYTEALPKEYIKCYTNITDRIIMLENIQVDNIVSDINILNARTCIEKPLILVVIDYIQLIPNKENKDIRLFLNDTVKLLKDIQQNEVYNNNNGCMFFMLSQVNRESSKLGISGLNSFRETSEIENISDIALTIDYKSKDEYENSSRIINIVKNKIGQKKKYEADILKNGIIESLKIISKGVRKYKKDIPFADPKNPKIVSD